jgi:hypothetical protein
VRTLVLVNQKNVTFATALSTNVIIDILKGNLDIALNNIYDLQNNLSLS